MKTLLVAVAALAAALPKANLVAATDAPGGLVPSQLRCEFVEDPLGVDVTQPRLFWKLEGRGRAQRQTAWQVLAGSSPGLLDHEPGDLWDSGKVSSDETLHIPYAGRPLKSSQQVFWKVRVWDQDGRVSAWSRQAAWTMGLLEEADWRGKWISAPGAASAEHPRGWQSLLLRREFDLKRGVKRALCHVCGLGQYELRLNGQKAGEDLLSPGWTKYDKTCLYETRDVTALLKPGPNAIGLILGNGMYNVQGGRYLKFKGSFGPPKAIAELVLEYDDGAVEILGTDERWRAAPGPLTFCCVYGGEDYDARLEPRGWDLAGFAQGGWGPALVTEGPGGRLKGLSCAAPPIRAFEVLKPVSVKPLRPGVAVYDLGQNVSLMPRLSVQGPAGAVVRIIPAELLKPDGSVDRGSCGGGAAYWQYTLAGAGPETWFPKFFYHGCRFLQVECSPPPGGQLPTVQSLEGVVVHSSSAPVGQFECSNPLFNRIRALVRWAQLSNMVSLMTDCPHREKLGWLEEDHLNGPSLRYEFDLARLFTKAMNDMADSQLQNGLVPDTAPEYAIHPDGFRDSPEWGSAFLLVPWQQYEFTADLPLLRLHYDAMKRYVAYLGSRASGQIVSHGLGDWYDLGPNPPGVAQLTPLALTATAFYYYDTWILSQAAALLDKPQEARQYAEAAAAIRAAFNQRFFHPATGQYATGSQCANAMPLVMGLAQPAQRPAVLDALVRDVRGRGNALTAGDVGYRYLLRALAEDSRSDVLFDVNNQSDKPGYGYQLRQGATSLTEAWDAGRASSQNHFMLGQIIEWFYHDLAGIGCDPAGPGFKKTLIHPAMVGDLTWASAAFKSIRGDILCSWTRSESAATLNLTIPPNTTATVFLPAKSPNEITESAVRAERSQGVQFLRQEPGQAVYQVASGQYDFRWRP